MSFHFLRPALLVAALAAGSVSAQPPAETPTTDAATYALSPVAMAFADDLAQRRGLDPQWVRQ